MHFKFEQTQLKNGARLVNVIAKGLPYSAVSFWARAGSRFDPKGKEGLSHFFEHLLMQSTQQHPDRLSRLRALESKGIYFNAYTEHESVRYFHIQPAERTKESLDLLLDGLNTSIIEPHRLEQERRVILEEEQRNRSTPNQFLWRLSQQALFPHTSLGRSLFGDKKSLSSITMKDILSFKNTYYTASNAIFVVIGNEKTERIKRYIEQTLHLPKGRKPKTQNRFTQPKSMREQRQDDSVMIGINIRTEGFNKPETIVFSDLFREILAGHWTALLNQTLRVEHGLTYWVDGVSEYFSDVGYTRFSFSASPDNQRKALRLAIKSIKHIADKPLSSDVLATIKTSYASNLMRRLQEPEYFLWWIGSRAVLSNNVQTPIEYVQALENISAVSLQQYAKRLLQRNKIATVCIG